jgi:hypothetical protein
VPTPPSSPSSPSSLAEHEVVLALVAESAKKSRVCWLTWSGGAGDAPGSPRLVWHAWYDDALLVLSGEDQRLPGAESATAAEVVMRSKDTGARLVTWSGAVEVVDPEDERWDAYATALLAVRLNLPDPDVARAQWRDGATILRVVPVGATGKR